MSDQIRKSEETGRPRKRWKIALAALGCAAPALAAASSQADNINVPNDYPTIQEAVDAAVGGDCIVIEAGVYIGVGNRDISFLGKAITISSTDPADQDVVANTIIDCEGLGRGFWFNSGESEKSILTGLTIRNGVALDGGGVECVSASPSILSCIFLDNTALQHGGAIRIEGGAPVIDDCTFIGNVCDFEVAGTGCGGAVHIHNGTGAITGSHFESNLSLGAHGGAVAVNKRGLAVQFCTFLNNNAWLSGGAVYVANVGVFSADQCSFIGNDAFGAAGGAVAAVGADQVSILNSMFDDNSAIGGGAVSLVGANGILDNTDFFNNIAEDGGAVRCSGASAVTMRDCTLLANTAIPCGGGAIWNSAELKLFECKLLENEADLFEGGAILNASGGSLTVVDCTIAGNESDIAGGGVSNAGAVVAINCLIAANFADQFGGGLANIGSALIINCTATVNRTSEFGEGGGAHSSEGSLVIMNSILWANDDVSGQTESAQIFMMGGVLDVRYTCIQGLIESSGVGNIGDDPMLVDPLGKDGDPMTYEDNDYHLLAMSPCIDAGLNLALPKDADDLDFDGDTRELIPIDLDGAPRIADDPASVDTGCGAPAIVDMGALEHDGVIGSPIYPGDLTSDGLINAADLAVLLGSWGPCETSCCLADINLDGEIDVRDLGELLGNWG